MDSSSLDGWDWPYILYVGRVWLMYSEQEIWRLTPRQFQAQLKVHEHILKQKYGTGTTQTTGAQDAATGFVDQIPGW